MKAAQPHTPNGQDFFAAFWNFSDWSRIVDLRAGNKVSQPVSVGTAALPGRC